MFCKISKKYRKVHPRLWDLACMILARIADERARWFDLGGAFANAVMTLLVFNDDPSKTTYQQASL